MHKVLHPIFRIFALPFAVDCEEVLSLPIQWKFTYLQCSDLKYKFLARHIPDFYKNHVLLPGRFYKLIIHAQQVVTKFGTQKKTEQLFFKMKHANSILRPEMSNHHFSGVFLLLTSLFNLDITFFMIANNIWCLINKLWLFPSEFSGFYLVLLKSQSRN